MKRFRLAGLVCFAAAVVANPGAAGAIGVGGGGSVDPAPDGGVTLSVGLVVTDPGSGVVYSGGGPGAPSPVRYVAVPASESGEVSVTFLCAADGAPVGADGIPWGWVYIVVGYDSLTGAEVARESVCVPLVDQANPSIPPPPAVPIPPSIVEIWDAVGLVAPELHVSPDGEGVTGLETWIWSGGPGATGVDVRIREWTVTGSARLVAYNVDPGDGTGTHDTTSPGDAERHALDHMYEVKGTYPLSVTAVWVAQVALTGPGISALPVEIGTAQLSTTRQYQVVEVVPVLLP